MSSEEAKKEETGTEDVSVDTLLNELEKIDVEEGKKEAPMKEEEKKEEETGTSDETSGGKDKDKPGKDTSGEKDEKGKDSSGSSGEDPDELLKKLMEL